MRQTFPVVVILLAVALLGATSGAQQATTPPSPAPQWVTGATCYEVFVRSFADSDGDGIGDLRGLTAKLDYINDGDPSTQRDLGASCIWLMPVAESPSYHGYDVTDYTRIDPDYGTNDDFKRFVAEAHRRGIRVLVDMVVNHVSSDHPWFQAALRDTTSPYRSWFRFSPTPGPKNRWGGNNWHRSPLRDEYYYGFFWGGMPDLDYRNPAVLEEMKRVATFWLTEMDVDGFRLDAVRHLFERDSLTENLPETHDVLREYAAHVRSVKPEAFTIGEVWEPIETLRAYYPDQLDSYFAFEVADSLVAAVQTARAGALYPPVLQLQAELAAHRYAPFLRNHDQPRTRSELGGDMAKARVASFLLLTMPGLPFVYYGEEIGMLGTKPDERIRTPMQWTSADGAGFSGGTPWQVLQQGWASTTVAGQDADPQSILNLHRRLIHLRATHPALAMGELIPLTTSDPAVAAYLRRSGDRMVLVLANLAEHPRPGVRVSALAGAAVTGTWALRSLFGGADAAPMRVRDDGSIDAFVPLAALAPHSGHVFELEAGRGRRQ